MTKTEAKIVRAEIRSLKSALTKRQKESAKAISERRKQIRGHEIWITQIETNTTAFVKSTTDRIAILEGRLNS